jgi:elongation factor P hydroxylase
MNAGYWGAPMGIDKDKMQAIEAAELRWQAEERMCAKTAGLQGSRSFRSQQGACAYDLPHRKELQGPADHH